MVDYADWLSQQPDVIHCPNMGREITLRACQKKLGGEQHHLRRVDPHSKSTKLEPPDAFRKCIESECKYYVPTKRRARSYRKGNTDGRGPKLKDRLNA